MPYHWLTHLSGAIGIACWAATLGFAVDATRGLQAYRAEQARRPGGAVRRPLLQTPLPLLLRLLYLACSYSFLLSHTNQNISNWLHVSPHTRQADVLHQVAPGDLHLDAASWFCVVTAGKFPPLNYVFCKFMCYCFFFIKQRTVRTMSPDMNWLEKIVLVATFAMWICIGIASWLIQGDRNDLDATCQMYVQVGFFFSVAVADAMLSAAYLYLFVQPLRETIRLNANHRRGLVAGGEAIAPIAKTSSARVAPENAYAVEGGPNPASPSAAASAAHNTSLALEVVMRRNTYAVATAIGSCFSHFSFTITAMAFNEPHMRKLTMPVALIDCTVMLAALCFVLHTRAAASSSHGSSTAPVVQVVSLRAKHSSTSDAPQTKVAFMPLASDRATSPVPTTKLGSPISTATAATSQPDRRRDEPDQLPV